MLLTHIHIMYCRYNVLVKLTCTDLGIYNNSSLLQDEVADEVCALNDTEFSSLVDELQQQLPLVCVVVTQGRACRVIKFREW